jgi:hypothetical protein
VNAGTLALTNTGSISSSSNLNLAAGATLDVSGRTDSRLTLNSGQTLRGNGMLNGSLTVGTNATLAPGGSIGVLTVTNAVVLNGTTFIELDRNAGTNDVLRGVASITYGGRLGLTNLSGTLAAGDSFKIFYASVYGGAFAALVPAMPGSGLAWDLSSLTNGTVKVSVAARPAITGIAQAGANVVIGGTSGVPNANYFVLTSTNLSSPLAGWTRVATNQFGFDGTFSFTNLFDAAMAQRFYLIQLP